MADSISKHDSISAVLQGVQREIPPELIGAPLSARFQDFAALQTVDGTRRYAALLQGLGFISQSERVFGALAENFPDRPDGPAGLAQIAMNRKDWNAALLRWNTLIATFPKNNNVNWLNAQARAAEALGRGGGVVDGGSPASKIDLAYSAMRLGHWPEALTLWEEVLAGSPENHSGRLQWRTARANALLELGKYADAEQSFQEVLRADPWMLAALSSLLRLQCDMGRHGDALHELRASSFGAAEAPVLFPLKMQVLEALGLFQEARASFALLLKHAVDLEVFEILFAEAPRLHEGWPLTRIRLHLQRKLGKLRLENTAPVDTLRARIQLTLKDYTGLQATARQIATYDRKGEIDQSLLCVAAASRALPSPDFQKEKVFGIGLSKTGTLTLATALATLGLRTLHWTNPLTGQLISEEDLHLFDAFTDIPMCTSFEKQFHTFPNAKFIYTTRPMESWCLAFEAHWQKVHGLHGFAQIKKAFASGSEFSYGSYFREIHSQLFLGYSSAADAYIRYDNRVREFFGGERQKRLLEFNVFNGDGWAKLCQFLRKEIPNLPFPIKNRRSR